MDTIFQKIIKREIPADIVYEDKDIIAFNDINPQAPIHILIVPKKIIETLNDINENDEKLIGRTYVVFYYCIFPAQSKIMYQHLINPHAMN